ncbi:hypothetical protein RGQ29_017964 [Quercus rubra]|uniref:Uncharacterized protein n=2 Tax=Quercus TaxID=3511 RepID=A0AAN7IP44_QUERU|nr:hypothetical protein RGQ29_022303 [Quercus rubra]KAK4594100.1 hypothetical protein RGQ29_017964 [Quercus rubra]
MERKLRFKLVTGRRYCSLAHIPYLGGQLL